MTPFHPIESQRVPTLTEVIELSPPANSGGDAVDALPADERREADPPAPNHAMPPVPAPWGGPQPSVDPNLVLPEPVAPAPSDAATEAALNQRVLSNIQRQVDAMLDYRLREALMPVLARVTDTLVRELRAELSATMQDVVARAVAQEVARQRLR